MILALLVIAAVVLGTVYVMTNNIPVLEPKGMIGVKERDLIIIASILMLIVMIPVFILTFIFAWKYRENNKRAKYTPDWEHNYLAEFLWWGIPVVIIVILAIFTWYSSHALSPFKPIESDKKPLKIQVISLNWKWLFLYPEQGIATINYIQVPEKTPLNFEITSDAPMNSFWIPQLGGQIYAMPAMTSQLHLIANEIGTYKGVSSNISGKGFAGMRFTVKSTSQSDFDQWVKNVHHSPKRLDFNEYLTLVQPSEYDPVALYVLTQRDLFQRIIKQYSAPAH